MKIKRKKMMKIKRKKEDEEKKKKEDEDKKRKDIEEEKKKKEIEEEKKRKEIEEESEETNINEESDKMKRLQDIQKLKDETNKRLSNIGMRGPTLGIYTPRTDSDDEKDLSNIPITPKSSINLREEVNVLATFYWTGMGAKSVYITGSFNRWKDIIPLIEIDGFYSVTLYLKPARYLYKFYVDWDWAYDQNQSLTSKDDQGNYKNWKVITVAAGIETKFSWTKSAKSVSICGSFTGWKTLPLEQNSEMAWVYNSRVPVGLHQYRYLVDNVWTHNPNKPFITRTIDGQTLNNNWQLVP